MPKENQRCWATTSRLKVQLQHLLLGTETFGWTSGSSQGPRCGCCPIQIPLQDRGFTPWLLGRLWVGSSPWSGPTGTTSPKVMALSGRPRPITDELEGMKAQILAPNSGQWGCPSSALPSGGLMPSLRLLCSPASHILHLTPLPFPQRCWSSERPQ